MSCATIVLTENPLERVSDLFRSSEADCMPRPLQELEDWPLVQRCQQGNEDAYAVLVERYSNRAYWASYKILGNHEDATDIAQDAFIKAYQSLDRFRPGARFYTWLHRIVVNLTIDHLRKRRVESGSVSFDQVGDLDGKHQSPEKALEDQEIGGTIHSILASLPPLYRTVLVLRNVEEKSCKEIADIVGANYATVRWRLHKARQLFMEEWEQLGTHSQTNDPQSTDKGRSS
jgi:RNA polymerase sigma-70 factor (ECF subfamily)